MTFLKCLSSELWLEQTLYSTLVQSKGLKVMAHRLVFDWRQRSTDNKQHCSFTWDKRARGEMYQNQPPTFTKTCNKPILQPAETPTDPVRELVLQVAQKPTRSQAIDSKCSEGMQSIRLATSSISEFRSTLHLETSQPLPSVLGESMSAESRVGRGLDTHAGSDLIHAKSEALQVPSVLIWKLEEYNRVIRMKVLPK